MDLKGEPSDEAVSVCITHAHADPNELCQADGTLQNERFDAYHNLPFLSHSMRYHLALIYDAVRSAGRPNALAACISLFTSLVLFVWQDEATGHQDDSIFLDGIAYGFLAACNMAGMPHTIIPQHTPMLPISPTISIWSVPTMLSLAPSADRHLSPGLLSAQS